MIDLFAPAEPITQKGAARCATSPYSAGGVEFSFAEYRLFGAKEIRSAPSPPPIFHACQASLGAPTGEISGRFSKRERGYHTGEWVRAFPRPKAQVLGLSPCDPG